MGPRGSAQAHIKSGSQDRDEKPQDYFANLPGPKHQMPRLTIPSQSRMDIMLFNYFSRTRDDMPYGKTIEMETNVT